MSVPAEWRRIAECDKELLEWPVWPDPLPLPQGTRITSSRDEFNSSAAERLQVVVSLGEKAGPGIEGARLRIVVWAHHRERDVTATLEVQHGSSRFVTIARVDAWPSSPHGNLRARRTPSLKRLPAMIDETHVHRFDDNAIIGFEAFNPEENLPAAAPVDERPQSFREFLRIVSAEFRIDGLEGIASPDSWRLLI